MIITSLYMFLPMRKTSPATNTVRGSINAPGPDTNAIGKIK
jgi:hypothetical protein